MISFRTIIFLLTILVILVMVSGCGEQKPKSVIIPVKPPAPKIIEASSQDSSDDATIDRDTLEPTSTDGGITR